MFNNLPAPWNIHQHILLYEKVGSAQVEVQCNRVGDRTKRVMRRHPHRISLCHCCDLFRLPESSTMTEVGLDYMTSKLFKNFTKLESGCEPFPGCDWNRAKAANLGENIHVFRWHWLLYEEGPVGCKHTAEFDGITQ